MALHVYAFLFVICLFLLLALMWRHDWLHHRLAPHKEMLSGACSPAGFSPAAQTIALPVVSPPLPLQVESFHLLQYAPSVK